MLPNFIGIGAPRCGTTWLANCLAAHPDVFMARVKETNFLHHAEIDGQLPEYEKHFEGGGGRRAIGEISVRYLISPRAPYRVKQLLPEARLFVSLRNPVDQLYSHYWHLQRQGFHAVSGRTDLSLEEAIEYYPSLLVEPARYAKYLRVWLDLFGRERLHVILFDDIQTRPDHVISELYRFLGVDSTFQPPTLNRKDRGTRAGNSPRSKQLEGLYQHLYRGLVRFAYTPLKQMIGVRQAIMLKERLHAREIMERVFRKPGYPPIPVATRRRLQSLLIKDIAELEVLLGRKLPAWHSEL